MKWFRHMTHARRDPVIEEARNRFGDRGYTAYFVLLEMIGENYSLESPGKLRLTWDQLGSELKCYRSSAKSILSYYAANNKFSVNWDDTHVWVYCPKFKEMADRYTKARMHETGQSEEAQLYTHSKKTVPRLDKIRTEKESNTNEVVKETVPERGQGPSSVGDILRFWRR